MSTIKLLKDEPIERALKRLKIKIEIEGTLEDLKRKKAFETPAQKANRKNRINAKRQKLNIRPAFSCPFPPSKCPKLDNTEEKE